MSLSCLEKELNEIQKDQIQQCVENAVFTVGQTKEIVRLDVIFNKFLLKKIDDLFCKLSNVEEFKEVERKVECFYSELEKLIIYDENNTEIISKIKRDVEHSEYEINCLEEKVDKFDEKVAVTLISQANEIEKLVKENKINCIEISKISKMECKLNEIKEQLLRNERREMKDFRVDKILEKINVFVTKEDFENVVKSVLTLETKEIHDKRVDLLLCEFSKLEKRLEEMTKTNILQSNAIKILSEQNTKQNEEIKCLSEKLNRNILALDGKIDEVEKHELANKKIDCNQNASLNFMQSEISRLTQEIDKMQKIFLVKPISQ